MAIDPYDHEHSGVMELTWAELESIVRGLMGRIGQDWRPDVVVGIAKGGVIPGVMISSAFRVDFVPIKLSSRRNETIVSKKPAWHVYPPASGVTGKKILLVDDICVAGRTFSMATEELGRMGAAEVRTASAIIHEGSVRPDYVGLVSDAYVIWPWERDVLAADGRWIINPDYKDELKESE